MKNQPQNMEKQRCRKKTSRRFLGNILFAGLVIAVGVLLLLNNLQLIDPQLYRVLFSWQMLLIVVGAWELCSRHPINGVIVAGVGAFFMIPLLSPVGNDWVSTYWPLVFILLGVVVIIQLLRPSKPHRKCMEGSSETLSQDGFVDVNNSFGSVRHIVLDPIFKGARIQTRFSGTILDLRRTTLGQGETYIDVEMRLSGLEILVPEDWTVVVDQVSMMMAGVDDKRYRTGAPDNSRKLVVRGSMSMSGLEIKS